MNQTSKFTLLTRWVYILSPHSEMCGNSSLQPQQLCVMPAPVSGHVIFHPTTDTIVEGERMCVFVWKAHLAEKKTSPTPPLHQTDLNLPPRLPPHLLFLRLPSHLLPFPHPHSPEGEMDLCLGLVMSLLATWGFRVQRSELEELSHFVYNACRLWYMHVNVETVSVYRSGIVYSLWSSPFIISFVVKFM